MTVAWADVVTAVQPEHPYQLFPPLSPDEYVALRQDIADRGVLVPVEFDEAGNVLDGHHRVAIAAELSIEYPFVVREGMTEQDKYDHVFALNMARRHLSGHDRTAVVADLRRRGLSLRAIARLLDVGLGTVHRSLADVPDGTPFVEQDEPEYSEPLPPVVTRAERAADLRDEGMTLRDIADDLGVSHATVAGLLNGPTPSQRTRPDVPVEWPQTRALIDAIKDITSASPDPRRLAQSVPERNRASVARTLRQVGTYLGSIALELERSDR